MRRGELKTREGDTNHNWIDRFMSRTAAQHSAASAQATIAHLVQSDESTDEIVALRSRYDDANATCKKLRERLAFLRRRTDTYVSVDDLDWRKAENGVEIERLEQEIERVAAEARETYFARRTYEQIIRRLKAESTTYNAELGHIDAQTSAKARTDARSPGPG